MEEARQLETPQESVAFLQYMLNHQEKISLLQKRLAAFSKMLLFTGVTVASVALISYFQRMDAAAQPKGRLGASNSSSDVDLSSMFSGMSVLIWSMVAAKAKSGMSASDSGESKTVGSHLKQAGSLILMIMLASGFNIYSQLET